MSRLPYKLEQARRIADRRRRRIRHLEGVVVRLAEIAARCEDRTEEAETALAVPELGRASWYLSRLREAFGNRLDVHLGTAGDALFLQVRDPQDGRMQAFTLNQSDLIRPLEEVAAEVRAMLEQRGILPKEDDHARR